MEVLSTGDVYHWPKLRCWLLGLAAISRNLSKLNLGRGLATVGVSLQVKLFLFNLKMKYVDLLILSRTSVFTLMDFEF